MIKKGLGKGLSALLSIYDDENEEIADIENITDSMEDESKYGIIDKIFEVPAIPVSLFTGLTSLGYVSILSFYSK